MIRRIQSQRCRIWSALVLVIAALFIGSGTSRAQTPDELFESGNRAYQDGRFDEASELYQQVLKFRIEDPRLEFNLGNAEFKLGRKGSAILHFQRARRLDPTDEEILDNLKYARSFLVDQVETVERPMFVAAILKVQQSLGPDGLAWIGVALLWLLAAILMGSLFRAGRWSALSGWGVALILVLLIVVGFTWNSAQQRLEGAEYGVVMVSAVEILAGPGNNNAAIHTIHEGLTVEIRDIREDWVQVSLPNGLSGWLPSKALGVV